MKFGFKIKPKEGPQYVWRDAGFDDFSERGIRDES